MGPSSQRVTGARVLVVEDGAGNRRVAAFTLRRLGCHAVEAAADGDEVLPAVAAAAAAGVPYDLIMMDLVMVC